MNHHDIKVSVEIVTYNHEEFIAQAVESALAQETDFNFEIVIGEDCSTDSTRSILLELQQQHPGRIRLLLHNENLGASRNFAATLEACQGEYVAILEGDDYWSNTCKLQKQVDHLDTHPDIAVCHHNALTISDDEQSTAGSWCQPPSKPRATLDDLLRGNFIVTCTVMFRNHLFPALPEWYFHGKLGDWPLHMLNAQHGDIAYLDEVMATYRTHAGGYWSTKSRLDQLLESISTAKLMRTALTLKHKWQIDKTVDLLYVEIAEILDRLFHEGRDRPCAMENVGHLGTYRRCDHFYRGLEHEAAGRRVAAWGQFLRSLWAGRHHSHVRTFDILLATIRTSVPQTYVHTRRMWRWLTAKEKSSYKNVRIISGDKMGQVEGTNMSDPHCKAVPKAPQVSVVVPNYNHRPFLTERLETILAQTFTDYELLLLDDASSDGSVELLQRYANRPNVRLLLNQSNSGSPFAQWNRGVEEARGDYIWIAESDDTAEPQFLETLVDILDDHPNVGVAECDVPQIDSHGNRLQPFQWDARSKYAHRWTTSFLADGPNEVREFLYFQNTIPSASAIVFRRSVYRQAGPADPTLKICGDWLQWARMLLLSDLHFVAEPLACSRIHSASQRGTTWKNGYSTLESLLVQGRIQQLINIDHLTIRGGTQRYATSWLQNVRAGRYTGPIRGHFTCFLHTLRNDRTVGLGFLVRFPYALAIRLADNTIFRAIWSVKNTMFRKK